MAEQKRTLTLDDFWRLKQVTEVQISPDGKTAAYVVGSHDERTNKTKSAIWLVDLESGESRQFSSGEVGDNTPRWSPDGSRLAFVSRRHEDKPQVFVMSLRGGEPRRLTSASDGAHTPVWSPDGSRICFTSDVESDRQKISRETAWFEAHTDADQKTGRMRLQTELFSRFDGRGYIEKRPHLFLIEVDAPDAEARQLTEGDQDDLAPVWSPDGAVIAFLSNRREDAEHHRASDIWLVGVDGEPPQCLTSGNLMAQLPSWSPDGQTIAFYAREEFVDSGYQDTHVWTISRWGGEARDISSDLDQCCVGIVLSDYMMPSDGPPSWSPDGNTIYFVAVDRGDRAIFAVSPQGGPVRRVSPRHALAGAAECTPDGSQVICIAATPTQPFDVFTVPATGGDLRQVTHVNADLMAEVEILPTENITFQGPGDREIEGWLVAPGQETPRPYPLILLVHGGPQAAWGNAFYFWAQVLAGEGYAALFINPRGSLGYGEKFAWAADWGQDDFADLMAGVDAVVARGQVDTSQLGVTGASYGGFMTNWTLGHTDRFAAGVAVNSISNFVSFYGVSDIGAMWFDRTFHDQFGGEFWKNRDRWMNYIDRSPITYVDNITAPLLLISGENDYRCPIEQAEQMLTALRMLHRTVELVRLPGASHGILLAPHQRYLRWQLTKDWFDTYVKRLQPVPEEEEAGITAAPAQV